jgi:hypothetical protein
MVLEHLAKSIAEMKPDVPEIIVKMKTDTQIQAHTDQHDNHRRPPQSIGDRHQSIQNHSFPPINT